MCGEQVLYREIAETRRGSPPRVRGTVASLEMVAFLPGITPACAGNRDIKALSAKRAKDHPRVCGEQGTERPLLAKEMGSPPRVRGTGR